MTQNCDQVNLAAFLLEVRRRAPQGTHLVSEAKLRDPFGTMITQIRSATHTMEHRILARLLRTIVDESASETAFRITEIAALSPAVLLLLSAFIDNHINGRYNPITIRATLFSQDIRIDGGQTEIGR